MPEVDQHTTASSSEVHSAAKPRDPFESFTYLVVEKSDLYREIMAVFAESKAEFRLTCGRLMSYRGYSRKGACSPTVRLSRHSTLS
jgi:hypothetical protein